MLYALPSGLPAIPARFGIPFIKGPYMVNECLHILCILRGKKKKREKGARGARNPNFERTRHDRVHFAQLALQETVSANFPRQWY